MVGKKYSTTITNSNAESMLENNKGIVSEALLVDIQVDDAAKLRKLKNYNYFIILPDDNFKKKWDLFMTLCLLFTSIMTPYRLAFYDADNNTWLCIDSGIDTAFAVDMVLNFFIAYYDDTDDIVDSRKKIACTYLRKWFLIDIVSIFPISQILNTDNYSRLARITRLPKLYRLIKVFRYSFPPTVYIHSLFIVSFAL